MPRKTVKHPRPATRAAALAAEMHTAALELQRLAVELLAIVGPGMDASLKVRSDSARKRRRRAPNV